MGADDGLPAGPVLVLSPHADDAMFSLSSVVLGRPCEVWTVMAGVPDDGVTDWDRRCGFDSSSALMRARRREDEDAFADTPATLRHLDFFDRAYAAPGVRVSDATMLIDLLTAWLAERPGGLVLVPAGAGTTMRPGLSDWIRRLRGRAAITSAAPATPHGDPTPARRASWPKRCVQRVLAWDFDRRRRAAQRAGMLANEDHVWVRDVVVAQHRSSGRFELACYEELPYLWGRPADAEVAALASAHGYHAELRELPVDRERKAALLAHYVSQVRLMDPVQRRLERADTLPLVERVWLLRRR